ncbi:MAG: cobalamin B12-binding domain-containing protein [Phycisphaerae bacterium]|nr:cobalamin B12-binding domain-containing protein [Phycisphaerae bacterium]
MHQDAQVERLFESLIVGDRANARALVNGLFERGRAAEELINELFWPTHETIEKLHRADQLTCMSYNMSTRLLRQLTDQAAARLVMAPRNNRTVLAACGTAEGEELGAQMAVDLLEAHGYTVAFMGGGVAADEILGRVHEDRPDVLLMFCSSGRDLPGIRHLVDTLHEIGACPNMQIVVGGGVFNRAAGLADELGADLCAVNPLDLVDLMANQGDRRAKLGDRTVGKKLKKAA